MLRNDIVVNTSQPIRLNVFSPIGGFGNHLRWLLLLDKRFQFTVVPTQEDYNTFVGPSWPTYEEYCKFGIAGIKNSMIVDEINDLTQRHNYLETVACNTVTQKLDFIERFVYNEICRTHLTWLFTEYRYRIPLCKLIHFDHDIDDSKLIDSQSICMTIDPNIAFRCYYKFNTFLNYQPVAEFMKSVSAANQKACEYSLQRKNIHLISGDRLWSPTLDVNLYCEIISKLELDDNYNIANIVHQHWYTLHKKAERSFVEFAQQLYK